MINESALASRLLVQLATSRQHANKRIASPSFALAADGDHPSPKIGKQRNAESEQRR